MSFREAQAAKELLLDRLMTVHPEVNGGELTHDGADYLIKVSLEKGVPKHASLPTEFMGYRVVYNITGWVVAQ